MVKNKISHVPNRNVYLFELTWTCFEKFESLEWIWRFRQKFTNIWHHMLQFFVEIITKFLDLLIYFLVDVTSKFLNFMVNITIEFRQFWVEVFNVIFQISDFFQISIGVWLLPTFMLDMLSFKFVLNSKYKNDIFEWFFYHKADIFWLTGNRRVLKL